MINNATIETLSDNSFWLRNYVYGPRCEKAKIPILPAKINSSTILIGKQISREEKNMAHHYRCRIFWNISNFNVVVFFLKYIQIGFCVMKRKSKKCFHVYLGIEFPNFYFKMISGFFSRANTRNANRIYFSMHYKKRNLTETTDVVVECQLWKLLTV